MTPDDPEFDILLQLLKRFLHPALSPKLKIEAPVDWERLQRIATFHRVMPMIYRALQETDDAPAEILERFRRIVVVQSAVNLRAAARLQTLLRHFYQRDITAIPFKGHILAAELYDDVAVRACVDYDLYVPRKQISESIDLLSGLGYQSALLQRLPVRQALARYHTLDFTNPAMGSHIDLHLDPTDGYAPLFRSEQDLSRRTRSFQFDDEPIRIFDEEVTAMLIAVHGAKDSWAYLGAWLDLALFFRRYPQLSYESILRKLREWGVGRMLCVGASLAERFLAVTTPASIQRHCDNRSREVSRHIAERLRRDPLHPADAGWAKVMLNIKFRATWLEKARYLYFKAQPKKVDVLASMRRPSLMRHLQRVLHTKGESVADRA